MIEIKDSHEIPIFPTYVNTFFLETNSFEQISKKFVEGKIIGKNTLMI